ncbi:BnaAnng19160D [Brassica napus]|uniref:BnaAnng19160D protein n=2 Tax=Brassica napus TaxID=3708 RepID=A0A078JD05_BRANA|nr:BnaAnng19160D [Brassica napus]
MVSEQFDSGDNMPPLDADRVHMLKQMQQKVRELTSQVGEQRQQNRDRVKSLELAVLAIQERLSRLSFLEQMAKRWNEEAKASGISTEEIQSMISRVEPILPVMNNIQKIEPSRTSSEPEDEDPPVKKLVEKDLMTGEMANQLVISEKAGDARSCEKDAQGEVPALLQKTQSAVKKGKIRKKKKRWKVPCRIQWRLISEEMRNGLGTRQRKEAQQQKDKNQNKDIYALQVFARMSESKKVTSRRKRMVSKPNNQDGSKRKPAQRLSHQLCHSLRVLYKMFGWRFTKKRVRTKLVYVRQRTRCELKLEKLKQECKSVLKKLAKWMKRKYRQKHNKQRKMIKLNVLVILTASRVRKRTRSRLGRMTDEMLSLLVRIALMKFLLEWLKRPKANLEIWLNFSEKWSFRRELKVWDRGQACFGKNQWQHMEKKLITVSAAVKTWSPILQRKDGSESVICFEWDPGGSYLDRDCAVIRYWKPGVGLQKQAQWENQETIYIPGEFPVEVKVGDGLNLLVYVSLESRRREERSKRESRLPHQNLRPKGPLEGIRLAYFTDRKNLQQDYTQGNGLLGTCCHSGPGITTRGCDEQSSIGGGGRAWLNGEGYSQASHTAGLGFQSVWEDSWSGPRGKARTSLSILDLATNTYSMMEFSGESHSVGHKCLLPRTATIFIYRKCFASKLAKADHDFTLVIVHKKNTSRKEFGETCCLVGMKNYVVISVKWLRRPEAVELYDETSLNLNKMEIEVFKDVNLFKLMEKWQDKGKNISTPLTRRYVLLGNNHDKVRWELCFSVSLARRVWEPGGVAVTQVDTENMLQSSSERVEDAGNKSFFGILGSVLPQSTHEMSQLPRPPEMTCKLLKQCCDGCWSYWGSYSSLRHNEKESDLLRLEFMLFGERKQQLQSMLRQEEELNREMRFCLNLEKAMEWEKAYFTQAWSQFKALDCYCNLHSEHIENESWQKALLVMGIFRMINAYGIGRLLPKAVI